MEKKLTKEEYNKQRQFCPKCGSSQCMRTLVAYIWNDNKPEEYKNLNKCTCLRCEDVHTFHDRVNNPPEEAYRKIHDDVRNIFSNKYLSLNEKFNKFNDYIELFLEERNRGLLRTILVLGKSFKYNPIVEERLEKIYQQLEKLRLEAKQNENS